MATNNAAVSKTTLRIPGKFFIVNGDDGLALVQDVRYFEMDWQVEIRFDRSILNPQHPQTGRGQMFFDPRVKQQLVDSCCYLSLIAKTSVQLDTRKAEEYQALAPMAKIDILNSNEIPVFTFIGQWKYSNVQKLEKFCNWTEISRHHTDLYVNDKSGNTFSQNNYFNMVLSIGPPLSLTQSCTDKSLLHSLKTMFEKGILTDAVVKTETKTFPCHKVVLAAASDVFKTMLDIDTKESTGNAVHLEGVFEADTVQDLLHYVYTMQVPPNIESTCSTLFVAADYFQLPVLKEFCEIELCNAVKVENAASILQLAEKYNAGEVKRATVKFIVSYYKEVMATSGWNDITPDMAKSLLSTVLVTVADKN